MAVALFRGPEAAPRKAPRPAPVAPPAFGGKRWWRPDVACLLTGYAALLLLIPARLVVPSVGGTGRPALLFGLGLLALWGASRVVPYATTPGKNPMRRVLIVFGIVFLLTYAMGHGRGLPPIEGSAVDRNLIATASLLGVALVAADGIPSRQRLDVLLKRVTVFGAVVGVIGALQFLVGIDVASMIKIPGLRLNANLYTIGERGGPGFRRVSGTGGHPIEFGVLMAMMLPIAIHYALHGRSRRERLGRWLVLATMAVGVFFSISRSGVLALAVVILVLGVAWAPSVKVNGLIVAVVGAVLLRAAVPGLLGTFRSLFLNAEDDPSIEGRTNDYEMLWGFVRDRPWFGRGPGTFIPDRYFTLDNQLLLTLVQQGYLGLLALLALYFVGMSVARRVARRGGSDPSRHLGQSLMAAVAAGLIVTLTFDSLSFAQHSGYLFLVLGCIGALWRLERLGDSGRNRGRRPRVLKPWRSKEYPQPHPLERLVPDYAEEHRWRSPRPV